MKGWGGALHDSTRKHLATGLAVAIVALGLSGCVVQRREKLPSVAAPVWQEATLAQLLEKIRAQQNGIQTMEATVELQPSVSSTSKGEIVHYRDVRAFLLIRKPAFLRMIGLSPVVRSTAFDMASDGENFGLYVPSRNRFIIGKSRGGRRSESPLENLRPQHILDALLWEGLVENQEQAALEATRYGQKAYYLVHILRPANGEGLVLARRFWFEREGLSLERLQIFDENGEVVTDVWYSNYAEFSGIPFPQRIVMDRSQDQYGLILEVSKLEFNGPLEDEKFHLEKPAGAELINLEKQSLAGKAGDIG